MHQPLQDFLRKAYQSAGLLLMLGLTACAGNLAAPARDSAVLESPVETAAIIDEGVAYRIVPEESEIRLLVYRDGPLARFGHNHVITGSARGELHAAESVAASRFRIEVPVREFVVDPAPARTEEGDAFKGNVSEAARRGTRENLLGPRLLDADAHPFIVIESIAMQGPRWNPEVTARVTLRNATRNLRFNAAVFESGQSLSIVAGFRIRQSDFDIEPFSVMGGGLQVADEVDIRIRIVARR